MNDFTACLVTRGDIDLDPVREPLDAMPGCSVVVWDNSVEKDLKVLGRYAAVELAETDLVYVQDDDVVVPADSILELLKAWRPGHVAANMPERFRHDFYRDHCLVGFGAVFERQLAAEALCRLWDAAGAGADEDWICRTCDIAVTALAPRILVDVPYRDLDYATAPNRMWKQPGHVGERKQMLELVRELL